MAVPEIRLRRSFALPIPGHPQVTVEQIQNMVTVMKITFFATATLCLATWIGVLIPQPTATAQDADRDGLPDAVETNLGTDPDFAEPLMTVGTFPAKAPQNPELDIVRVDFGNVARDRWIWAIRFARPYRFDNSTLIVYLDTDNDAATGRKDMGCEVMISHDRGRPGVTAFAADGTYEPASLPRVALVDGVLYLCHDGSIEQENEHSVFRFTVLSETREPHASVDGTGWIQGLGPANSERPKSVMLDDITADENFERTEGLDLVWQLQADPANAAISSIGAELSRMAYYDTEYRWPAMHGASGTITVTVPKAGRFYPAIVVYDTAGREAYELQVDGKCVGRFLAAEDDNRQRIHFLSRSIDFHGGEKLTFRTGTVGRHITEDILLLAEKPPVRNRKFEMNQVEAGYVVQDGQPQLRVTWITTWPAACTVHYGPTADCEQNLTEVQPCANHRVFIPGLQVGNKVHFRIVASRPDSGSVASPAMTFAFQPPAAVTGTAKKQKIPLVVENPHDFALADSPVTNGVPFAQGELGDPAHVRLLDPNNREVPVQTEVAIRWNDGSVKWVRASFLASSGPRSSAKYTLEYGTGVKRVPASSPLKHRRQDKRLVVETGPLEVYFDVAQSGFPTRIRFDADADGRFAEDEELTGMVSAEVTNSEGNQYTTAARANGIEIEEAGPVRIVVKVTGHHRAGQDGRMFAYTNRFTFYAGLPFVRVRYTWGNDNQEDAFTTFEQISLKIPLPVPGRTWTVGLGDGNKSGGEGEFTLTQLRDTAYEMTPAPAGKIETKRADGWVDVGHGRWGMTVVVRDFWQLYPKGIRLGDDGLSIDACPDFPDGTYDGCSKLDEIKLYYYLMGGEYKVARGVQKQHELMVHFHAGSPSAEAGQLAQAFQEPLIAACSPERYCGTGVFGEILPATAGRSVDYEAVCEKVYQNYIRHREASHEYGMLNFGDQWGERRVNWANGEYDHHHAFLLQFIRTGDRKWYFLGETAARHAIDVDTCHFGPRRGVEWIHSMGHTGGYFTERYEGNGIPGPGASVSHTWTEGFCDWYVLSGDRTAAENAALVADYYDGLYLNNYDWSNCRTNGWHLLLTMAAYRATNDPYYLNAARIIVQRTSERQTPGGGWHRQMVPGHCHDMPRHRGVANFMLGVLANGLEEYYREIPDPRVAEAILGGAKQAVNELWVDEVDGFRYTSCPNMKGYTANNDMTAEILFFAHRLGGDPEYGQIALRAMHAAFRGGIGSIAHLRWTPHIIYNMDVLERGAVHEDTAPLLRSDADGIDEGSGDETYKAVSADDNEASKGK